MKLALFLAHGISLAFTAKVVSAGEPFPIYDLEAEAGAERAQAAKPQKKGIMQRAMETLADCCGGSIPPRDVEELKAAKEARIHNPSSYGSFARSGTSRFASVLKRSPPRTVQSVEEQTIKALTETLRLQEEARRSPLPRWRSAATLELQQQHGAPGRVRGSATLTGPQISEQNWLSPVAEVGYESDGEWERIDDSHV